MNYRFLIILFLLAAMGCQSPKSGSHIDEPDHKVTIFFVSDVHGQLDNFAKIKNIVDEAGQNADVILACSGDAFSGNPVVDQYEKRGFPIIDIMNHVGFEVMTLGNHEFDYGESALKNRMEQSNFEWVCANVDMNKSIVPDPHEYFTITAGDIDVAFLGLIETLGKKGAVIPSTHPWRVKEFEFQRAGDILGNYSDLKKDEDIEVLIALSHLGVNGNENAIGDFQLAREFPFFDLIISGHNHRRIDTVINGIPVFQAGSYLHYLGKIELAFNDERLIDITYEEIDLSAVTEYDEDIQKLIDGYKAEMDPYLNEVIGYSTQYQSKTSVGAFMTEAMRATTQTDVVFQNTGGVRSNLDKGDITRREIFEIDPFYNGMVVYEKTVGSLEKFLEQSQSGFYYSGVIIEQVNGAVELYDIDHNLLNDQKKLSVGINDYVAAVHDFFGKDGDFLDYTSSDAIMNYLNRTEREIDFTNSNRYFRFSTQ